MTRKSLSVCMLLLWLAIGRAALAQSAGSTVATPPAPVGSDETRATGSVVSALTAAAQDAGKDASAPPVRVVWDDRPSFRFGRVLRVDVVAKFHLDARDYDPPFEGQPDDVEVERKRVGVEGALFRVIEFEVETELRRENPVRDAYVNVAWNPYAEIRAGKFKIPFSLDELTSDFRQDFINRSRIADNLAPARSVGAAVRGATKDDELTWQAGVFRDDGENAQFGDNPGAGTTVAARVTGQPLRSLGVPKSARALELGFSIASAQIDEGLNGLRLETSSEAEVFSPVYVKGARRRLGIDLLWRIGPASLRAEAIGMYDEREEQGVSNEDLSDVLGRGWYASASWLLTSEEKRDNVRPRRDLITGGGIGAIELVARYEVARFGSREHPGPPFRNPRAENILGNRDRAWTFGVNWYLNRYSKLQFNAIREDIEDTVRSPVPGREVFWSYVGRLQVAM